jgi:ATP-grasp domain
MGRRRQPGRPFTSRDRQPIGEVPGGGGTATEGSGILPTMAHRPVVLVVQPGFPAEVPYYVRGLARQGAHVLGVGDQPASTLPGPTKEALAAYLRVPGRVLWQAPSLIEAVRGWDLPVKLERVECLWEVTMELSAELRRAFGLPGLQPHEAVLFRDKNAMRRALDAAGIRNPRYAKARSRAEVAAAAERVGFPLVIKPTAGAGSAQTYRVDSMADLERLLPVFESVDEVVLEEFVEGDEFTFDTLSAGGRFLFRSILRYRPTMLQSRSEEWISPQNMVLRDLSAAPYQRAQRLAEAVHQALGYERGIAHMEWFLKRDGDVVFGEIAGRPPGGMTGELMNYCCDFDVYEAWAEATLYGRISQPIERKYNVAMIFKRAQGQGRIHSIQGLDAMYRLFGDCVMRHELLPIGAHRRDWKQTLLSDGFVILRHPDLDEATRMSQWVAENVRLYAG